MRLVAWHCATANPRSPETPVEREIGWLPRRVRRWLPFVSENVLRHFSCFGNAAASLASLCEPTEDGKGKCNAAAAADDDGIRSYLTKGAAGGQERTKETRLDFSS